jgi:hypothetical protein
VRKGYIEVKKEKDFCKNKVTPWIRANKIYFFKPRGGPYSSRPGVPDYILCINGRFIGLEAKTDKGRLTQHQQMEREAIKQAGGAHFVVRPENWGDVKTELLELMGDTSYSSYRL